MARLGNPEKLPVMTNGDESPLQDQPPFRDDTEESEQFSVYPNLKYDSIMQETHPHDEQRSVMMEVKTAMPLPRHTMDDFQAVRIDPKDRRFETFDDTEPIQPLQTTASDVKRFGPVKILPAPVSHNIERHAAYRRPYTDSYPSEYGETSYAQQFGDEEYPRDPQRGTPRTSPDAYQRYGYAADPSWEPYPWGEGYGGEEDEEEEEEEEAAAGEWYEEPPAPPPPRMARETHPPPGRPQAPEDPKRTPWSSEGWPKDGGGFSLPQRGSHDMGVPKVSVDGGGESPKGSDGSSGSDSLMTEHCKEFHLKELAEHIVKGTLRTAVHDLTFEQGEPWKYRTTGTEGPNVEWPCNYGFTSVDGERKIDEFLDTWGIGDAWYHCVDFLYQSSDVYADYYYYEAKWSIPTRSYPIPQATVSVFFTIEVSKKKPDECPVDVKFQFETDPYIHTPGECKIREEWMSDTLKRKVAFFSALNF